jgi:hypothetical protein
MVFLPPRVFASCPLQGGSNEDIKNGYHRIVHINICMDSRIMYDKFFIKRGSGCGETF